MKITVLHPDLGIGGAERLIVDAALALQQKGHTVKVVTNQYDSSHAFKECSQLDIETRFAWVPRGIFGRCKAAFAYLRMCLAALWVALFMTQDVIVCDQISAALFVLRPLCKARLVFYCHFPDLLLTQRDSRLKAAYRAVIDRVEEHSMSLADVVCVNSNFTASIVRMTFKRLAERPLTVLYPSLSTTFFDTCERKVPYKLERDQGPFDHLFVSLNRFEGKKKHELAIDAFVELGRRLRPSEYARCHLVIAGGYDRRNEENLLVFRQLRDYALDCGISSKQHFFLQSPTDEEKMWLLCNARAILYTPSNEHFGIVPVESMYCGTPVIAVDLGGPRETVDHRKTGLLVEPNANAFCDAMLTLIQNEDLRRSMAEEGPQRVRRLFAFDAFANALDNIVQGGRS